MSYHFIPDALEKSATIVPLDAVHLFPGNARRGKVAEIVNSIRRHGQFRAIVVNQRDIPDHGGPNAILAGNHTWKGMDQLRGKGATHIATTFVDVDADSATQINLIDNKLSDDSEYDTEALLAQLQGLPVLDGTGYDSDDIDTLLGSLRSPDSLPEPGDAPSNDLEMSWGVIVECGDEAEQLILLERFHREGLQCRALMV